MNIGYCCIPLGCNEGKKKTFVTAVEYVVDDLRQSKGYECV